MNRDSQEHKGKDIEHDERKLVDFLVAWCVYVMLVKGA